MVIRVNFLGAQGAAEDMDRAVGDDLVRVHIRRCAASSLINIDDELGVMDAIDHLIGRLGDRAKGAVIQSAEVVVRVRTAQLHES